MSLGDVKGRKSLLGGKGEAAVEQRLQRIGELVKKEDELIRKLEANNAKMGSLNEQLGAAQSLGLKDIETKLQQQIQTAQGYATSGTARLSSMKAAKTVSANNQFKRSIGALVSDNSMNTDIAGHSRQSANVGAARMMANSMSSYGIEQNMATQAAQMQRQKVRIQDTSADIGKVPGAEAKQAGLLFQWDRMSQAQGLNKQALARQVSAGGTLGQQETRFAKMGDAIANSRRDDELTEKATAGELGSTSDTAAGLKAAQDKFTKALGTFNTALDKGAIGAAGRLGKSLDGLAVKVKEAAAAAQINNNANGGRGGGFLQGLASSVTAPARGFGIAAEEYGKYKEDANVSSVIRQGKNRTGMAQMANQNFGDQMGAVT